MEVLLLFLVNAIASGAIGHYVSKGLGKIDKDLPDLFDGQTDIKVIEKIISEKGIESQVVAFANNTFDNSIILPQLTTQSVTNRDKTELFLNFLTICIELSHKIKMDLLLPSSFVSETSFTLFSGNEQGGTRLSLSGLMINMPENEYFNAASKIYIFPVGSREEREKLWTEYLGNSRALRAETEDYITIKDISGAIDRLSDRCDVNKISSGSCYFRLALIMDENKKGALQISGDKASCNYWYNAIIEMTEGIRAIMEQQVLSLDEIEKMREAYTHIQSILDNQIN